MALFGNKKNKTAETTPDTVQPVPETAATILRRPRITEKAFAASQRGVYTFEVAPDANKHQIKAAVQALYKVSPVRVNIVKKRPRVVQSLMRSRPAHQSGYKKAYVFLKEGDTINFM